jgi:hypothetical protein
MYDIVLRTDDKTVPFLEVSLCRRQAMRMQPNLKSSFPLKENSNFCLNSLRTEGDFGHQGCNKEIVQKKLKL